MRFPKWLTVYGDQSFRGACPLEDAEQVVFFQWLREVHPDLARVALHPRNEGRRSASFARRQKREGMLPGASDIIIVASPPLVIELKRRDHTQSIWQRGQQDFLETSKRYGCTVCVALGAEGAAEAVTEYLETNLTKTLDPEI